MLHVLILFVLRGLGLLHGLLHVNRRVFVGTEGDVLTSGLGRTKWQRYIARAAFPRPGIIDSMSAPYVGCACYFSCQRYTCVR